MVEMLRNEECRNLIISEILVKSTPTDQITNV